ncbi:hypothetical protein DYB32_002913 [Aphanomyces invadans]|uniref:Chloride channel protein n=1 Tax=Aphanomyces invadans TaxID=157072 RepID=A0A3R6ZTH8_9STRA|nr:hypothetical protein DYB32_002913 [Aphanomyces invadans]
MVERAPRTVPVGEKKPLLSQGSMRSEPTTASRAPVPPPISVVRVNDVSRESTALTSTSFRSRQEMSASSSVSSSSPRDTAPRQFMILGDISGNLQSELSEDSLFLPDFSKLNDSQKKRKAQHMESFDYDFFESRVNQQHDHEQTEEDIHMLNLGRWVMTFFIGLGTAGVACFIEKFTEMFSSIRLETMERMLVKELSGHSSFGSTYLVYASISVGYVAIASYCVAILCPVAGGSGISEIKATLNGIKIHRIVRLKTLFCKALGVLFSVAGGLPVGKEGPMIHSGAVIGAGLSQGKSSSFGLDTSWTKFKGFRNDKEKRDFISSGAAAGVGAAFGAPIGGVLFALEEGASFWHQNLTWRTFFCAMVSAFVLNLWSAFQSQDFGTGGEKWGHLGNQTGTLSFGSFSAENKSYAVWDVPIFLAMGMLGGLLGALFNQVNTYLTLFRRASPLLSHKYGRFLESLVICFVMSLTSFWLSYAFGTCLPKSGPYADRLVSFYCPAGEYNDMASLYTVTGARSIMQLLHHTAEGSFTFVTLTVFFLSFYLMACWTYGIAVPSGLFVPSLLSGAAYGRLWVHALVYFHIPHTAPVGMFALIGAASMLGGMHWRRVFTSQFGNSFNHGLYDIHIHLKHLPFLEFDPPYYARYLRVYNIMGSNVIQLAHISRAGDIYDILKRTCHSGFPVVNEQHKFCGLIQRKHLCVMLQRKDFSLNKPEPYTRKPAGEESFLYNEQYALSYRDIESTYPRYPSITDIRLDSTERDLWMDLTPYMNPTPNTVQDQTPVPRAFRLFRSLGLRHLVQVVLNRQNEVQGIVSRKDLTPEHLKASLDHLSEAEKLVIQGYFTRYSRHPEAIDKTMQRLSRVSDTA